MVARSSEKAFMKKNGRKSFRRSAVFFFCSENGAAIAVWQRTLLDCIHSGLPILKRWKNGAKDSKIKIILLMRI